MAGVSASIWAVNWRRVVEPVFAMLGGQGRRVNHSRVVGSIVLDGGFAKRRMNWVGNASVSRIILARIVNIRVWSLDVRRIRFLLDAPCPRDNRQYVYAVVDAIIRVRGLTHGVPTQISAVIRIVTSAIWLSVGDHRMIVGWGRHALGACARMQPCA